MDDTNQIEEWISNELNRGVSPELLKSKLTEYGYDAKLVDIFLVKNAVNTSTVQNAPPALEDEPKQENPQPIAASNSEFDKLSFFGKMDLVFKNPGKFFTIMPQNTGYREPIFFYLIFLTVGSIPSILISTFWAGSLANIMTEFSKTPVPYYISLLSRPEVVYGIIIVVGLLSLFVMSILWYALLRLLGGNGTYNATVNVMCYGSVINLFRWIPIVGFFASLYGMYIYIIGYSKVHRISPISVVVMLLILFSAYAAFYIFTKLR